MNGRPRLARTGQTIDLQIPAMFFDVATRPVGGGEKSGAGVPSVYVVRYEPLLRGTLRCTEAEFNELETFWRATDGVGAPFTVRVDQNVATDLTVYWDSPSVMNGEELTFTRDDEDPSMLMVPVAFRRSTSTAFTVPAVPTD